MLMQYFSAVCPMVGECWYPLRGVLGALLAERPCGVWLLYSYSRVKGLYLVSDCFVSGDAYLVVWRYRPVFGGIVRLLYPES